VSLSVGLRVSVVVEQKDLCEVDVMESLLAEPLVAWRGLEMACMKDC